MLALYIQRELTARLNKEGLSAALAFEQLEPSRLSRYSGRAGRSKASDAYVLPRASPEQTAILRRLGTNYELAGPTALFVHDP
jgi:hypothetical protein